MKRYAPLAVLTLLAIPAWGQYAASTSGSTTANATIDSKPAFQISTGSDAATCTAGKDILFRSDLTLFKVCTATNTFTVAVLGSAYATLTDGATVTWAIASAPTAQASLTFTVHSGSRTLNITNPFSGGFYTLKVIQDSTGGEGLTLGTGCTWKVSGGGGGAVTPSTGASAIDILSFTYDGTNCYANFNKNFN